MIRSASAKAFRTSLRQGDRRRRRDELARSPSSSVAGAPSGRSLRRIGQTARELEPHCAVSPRFPPSTGILIKPPLVAEPTVGRGSGGRCGRRAGRRSTTARSGALRDERGEVAALRDRCSACRSTASSGARASANRRVVPFRGDYMGCARTPAPVPNLIYYPVPDVPFRSSASQSPQARRQVWRPERRLALHARAPPAAPTGWRAASTPHTRSVWRLRGATGHGVCEVVRDFFVRGVRPAAPGPSGASIRDVEPRMAGIRAQALNADARSSTTSSSSLAARPPRKNAPSPGATVVPRDRAMMSTGVRRVELANSALAQSSA